MRDDNIVLNNLSLEIKENTTCAFVGKSGGGKTTLIHLLLRYYDPTSGDIYLNNINYKNIKVSQLRSYFGIVSQDTQLFGRTIEENIT